ncbi:MAG: hypothetical protein ACE5IC_06405 [Candidatus Brocadiales bacterium]
MRKGTAEKCRVLRPAVKKRLIDGLAALEGRFVAARDSLAKGNEAEFLKNLSRARFEINELSLYSMAAIAEDCKVWRGEKDLRERIIQGISAAL